MHHIIVISAKYIGPVWSSLVYTSKYKLYVVSSDVVVVDSHV